MSTTWFTSDTHYGHANRMPGDRGFDSIEEHDEALIDNHNRIVGKKDIVYHLGDVGLAREEYIFRCVRRLKGDIHLVAGNHDRPWPGHKGSHNHQRRWMEVFKSVQAYGHLSWNKQRIVLSHLPYYGDHTENQRYGEWRLPDTGGLLLHGHVHGKWLVQGHQINVGVDVWKLRPVSFDELVKFASSLGIL